MLSAFTRLQETPIHLLVFRGGAPGWLRPLGWVLSEGRDTECPAFQRAIQQEAPQECENRQFWLVFVGRGRHSLLPKAGRWLMQSERGSAIWGGFWVEKPVQSVLLWPSCPLCALLKRLPRDGVDHDRYNGDRLLNTALRLLCCTCSCERSLGFQDSYGQWLPFTLQRIKHRCVWGVAEELGQEPLSSKPGMVPPAHS